MPKRCAISGTAILFRADILFPSKTSRVARLDPQPIAIVFARLLLERRFLSRRRPVARPSHHRHVPVTAKPVYLRDRVFQTTLPSKLRKHQPEVANGFFDFLQGR